ncbi:regulatory protein RecX-like [Phyllobates terribilis]|uniref:regulatory protein RecX-like n=1 Tax=Phyllobates terribilis TaxID=111132 RepID=UPI003CCB0F87
MGYDTGSMDSQSMEELEDFDEELVVGNLSAKGELSLQDCMTKTDAAKKAVELLAARAFSAMELRKKLLAKCFPANVIDGVLCDLQERGMLNDSLYAEAYSRSRWTSSYWGPRRIKQALYMKGVHQVDAENAIKTVFEEGEEGDQHLKLGISKSSLDKLYVQACKQWLRSEDASRDTRKGRMIRWLQYRGFNWSVVVVILKKLEAQYPS